MIKTDYATPISIKQGSQATRNYTESQEHSKWLHLVPVMLLLVCTVNIK